MGDYSFIANAPTPMENLGKIAAVQNQVNQNKLFQGQQAAGAALQAATGPDGQIDYARARALVSQDPRTAPFALEAMNKLLTTQGQSISNTSGQTNLQGLYAKNIRQIAGAVPPGPDQAGKILSQITKGAQMGLYPPDLAASFVGGATLADGTTFKDLAGQSAIAENNPAEMEAQFGKPETVSTGARNLAVTVNPVTNERKTMGGDAGSVALTLSPSEKVARVPTVGPKGEPETVPQASLADETGNPKPSALTGPGGTLKAGLSPAAQAAQGVTGQGNAAQGMALQTRASKVNDNKALLGNMSGLLDQFAPGPHSGFFKGITQLAAQYGLAPPGTPPANYAAAQEEFGKLAFQLAQSQFQALGGTGTDSKLDSTMHTSPSELLTRYGNKGIIALLKGNEDAVKAQAEAWQKWQDAGHGAETYGQFQTQWNRIYDPRTFQAQYATPAERQAMLKGMTADEQAKFKADYKRAHSLGWVK